MGFNLKWLDPSISKTRHKSSLVVVKVPKGRVYIRSRLTMIVVANSYCQAPYSGATAPNYEERAIVSPGASLTTPS
jgi:hypothetical protein